MKKFINWKCFFTSVFIIILCAGIYFIIFGAEESSCNNEEDSMTTSIKSDSGTTYSYKTIEGSPHSKNKILLIHIKGLILTEKIGEPGFFELLEQSGFTFGYDIKERLIRAAENEHIKAVMIKINSPGGTIGGSKAIGDGIEYYKEQTGNPVYAHIVDQGTSGAYWAAAATDNITAEVGSLVGSIGVIMGPFRTYDNVLAEGDFSGSIQTENGINYRFFTAGEYKDTGSPYREMTKEEEQHWQKSINDEYNIFISYISRSRNLSITTIKDTIKALPYGNKEALALGLIDDIGGDYDSFVRILKAAHIPETDYAVISEEQHQNFFNALFGAIQNIQKPQVVQTCSWCNKPLFLYDASFEVLKDRK